MYIYPKLTKEELYNELQERLREASLFRVQSQNVRNKVKKLHAKRDYKVCLHLADRLDTALTMREGNMLLALDADR